MNHAAIIETDNEIDTIDELKKRYETINQNNEYLVKLISDTEKIEPIKLYPIDIEDILIMGEVVDKFEDLFENCNKIYSIWNNETNSLYLCFHKPDIRILCIESDYWKLNPNLKYN
jgi:hypothetical protein